MQAMCWCRRARQRGAHEGRPCCGVVGHATTSATSANATNTAAVAKHVCCKHIGVVEASSSCHKPSTTTLTARHGGRKVRRPEAACAREHGNVGLLGLMRHEVGAAVGVEVAVDSVEATSTASTKLALHHLQALLCCCCLISRR